MQILMALFFERALEKIQLAYRRVRLRPQTPLRVSQGPFNAQKLSEPLMISEP